MAAAAAAMAADFGAGRGVGFGADWAVVAGRAVVDGRAAVTGRAGAAGRAEAGAAGAPSFGLSRRSGTVPLRAAPRRRRMGRAGCSGVGGVATCAAVRAAAPRLSAPFGVGKLNISSSLRWTSDSDRRSLRDRYIAISRS